MDNICDAAHKPARSIRVSSQEVKGAGTFFGNPEQDAAFRRPGRRR